MMHRRFLLAALLLTPAILLLALPRLSAAAEGKTVRLLTVGNSFSGNATRHLGSLAAAGGHTLIHQPISVGGASLELHAERARLNAEQPGSKEGQYTGGLGLAGHLKADAWDVVTIQQASIKSHDYATYQPFGRQLVEVIRTHAPKARLLIHQTWAYRADDSRFAGGKQSEGEPASREEMHAWLTAAYDQLATDAGAQGVLPVGDAFALAEGDAHWGFRPDLNFDAKKAVAPALPDQTHSLHVGWNWQVPKDAPKSTAKALRMDGHHAKLAGEYLGACVWYEVLFGEPCLDNPFVPKGLDVKHAAFLRETAHRAVQARQAAKK